MAYLHTTIWFMIPNLMPCSIFGQAACSLSSADQSLITHLLQLGVNLCR